jgi:regulator of protease activity HflC (stomatin/prohibitin superfamily)
MLDRLFDFIHDFLGLFQFWVIIDEYERGVCKTLGVRRRKNPVLDPGFHFVWPLGIDEVLVDNVVPCVDEFDEQSLTTKDGKSITLNAVVMWSINDIQKILFDVEDADSALEEGTCGIIGELVESHTWAELHGDSFRRVCERRIRGRVKKWGIKIHSVQFKNLTQSRAIRLL